MLYVCFTCDYRIAIITTINRIAIITAMYRIAIATTINIIAIITIDIIAVILFSPPTLLPPALVPTVSFQNLLFVLRPRPWQFEI